MSEKRLYRSRNEKLLFGVTAGLGDYFETDPTIVRLVFVLLCFLGGVGIILYIALVIVMPEEPADRQDTTSTDSTSGAEEFGERISETARELGERARQLSEEARAAFESAGDSTSTDARNAGQRVADAANELAQQAGQLGKEVGSSIGTETHDEPGPSKRAGSRQPRQLIGLVLLFIGFVFLMDNLSLLWWWNWDWVWPMILVGIGLFLLINNARRRGEQ